MKRTKKNIKTVDAILTADWHLREDQPTCRTDNFEEAQWKKVRQIAKLQKKYNCPVYHAGDLFHHWKPSPRLLSLCIEWLPYLFYTVYGNHDLPQHSMDLAHKSGVNTLIQAGRVQLLDEGHLGCPPKEGINLRYSTEEYITARLGAVWHKFVYAGKPPFPGAEKEPEGHWLMDEYPQFDLILTGDNHQAFVCKENGRLLVNPGSLTRQTADQYNFKPRVYLYNGGENKVQPYYLDIEEGVVSRQHIEKKKERDERITAFVERLDAGWESSLNFEENLKRFGKENDIEKPVMDIAYKSLEE